MYANKMKLIGLVLLLGFSLFSCLSEPVAPIVIGDISGSVIDATTFLPIPGVTIRTEPSTSTVTSAADGKFEIKDVAEGDYTLTASRTGYNEAISEVSVIAERSVNADIQMAPLASILVVNTNELNFGTSTSNQNIQIQNGGYGTLSWTLSKNQPWLSVTPTSGTTESETDLINVAVDRTGYNPGNYSDIISVITNSNAASISALMVVPNTEGPQLTIAPDFYDYGSSESSHQFEISNSGIGTLDWSASTNTSWLTMNVSSGSMDSGTNTLVVTVDRFELQEGQYSGSISISSNGGNQLITINANVSTTAELLLSTSELDFANNYGELQVVLSNSSTIPISWQAVQSQTWISVNPEEGTLATTPVVAIISVDRTALDMGTHTGRVDFIYAGGMASVTISVEVTSEPLENPVLQITGQTGNSVSLGWTRPSNSTSFLRYDIRRSTSAGITEEIPVLTSLATYSSNTYTDDQLTLGQTFYYRIYAVNSDGYGTPSNEVSYTTDFAAPGSWVLQASIDVSGNERDIYMVSNDRGYALIQNQIYEYLGSSWSLMTTLDSDYSYGPKRIVGASQNDIWVAGDRYQIWHYNGISWSEVNDIEITNDYYTYDYYSIRDISIISSNDIWFVGGYEYNSSYLPRAFHYDGTSFSEFELLSGAGQIVASKFISTDEGYVLTSFGAVFTWNGVGWSTHTSVEDMPGTGGYYSDLDALPNGELWVTRDYGWADTEGEGYHSQIIHYNGSAWISTLPPITYGGSGYGYTNVSMVSGSEGWAVGYNGSILFTGNGLSWSPVSSPTTHEILSIDMLNSTNGWAIGDYGTILRYIGD